MSEEKKELKEEEISKVSGGVSREYTGAWSCKKCDYSWNDDPNKAYTECPKCHSKDIIEISE